jgi:hypothetical protein
LKSTNQKTKNKKGGKESERVTVPKGQPSKELFYLHTSLLEKLFTAETAPSVTISLVFGRCLSHDDNIDGTA